jgi:hypothetical protein
MNTGIVTRIVHGADVVIVGALFPAVLDHWSRTGGDYLCRCEP